MFTLPRCIFVLPFVAEVSPCLLITIIPCIIQPIADKLRPGPLERSGALPRGTDGVVPMAAVWHFFNAVGNFTDHSGGHGEHFLFLHKASRKSVRPMITRSPIIASNRMSTLAPYYCCALLLLVGA